MNILTAATAEDVTGVLGIFGAVAKWLFSEIGELVTIVMANPLLLIPIGVVMTYTVISVFRRLF